MATQPSVKVLFVCTGNICRSPTAEGVFKALLAREDMADVIHVDSAGTHAYHVGEPPDSRAQEAARARDIDLSKQRARQVTSTDFETFDYVIAMDRANRHILDRACPSTERHCLHQMLDFSKTHQGQDVPDPYYGGNEGFEKVLDLIEDASAGLLKTIRSTYGL